jgi:hypothetical protein
MAFMAGAWLLFTFILWRLAMHVVTSSEPAYYVIMALIFFPWIIIPFQMVRYVRELRRLRREI